MPAVVALAGFSVLGDALVGACGMAITIIMLWRGVEGVVAVPASLGAAAVECSSEEEWGCASHQYGLTLGPSNRMSFLVLLSFL